MSKPLRRITLLGLILALALAAVSIAAAGSLANPNPYLYDDVAPIGVPDEWSLLGDAVVVENAVTGLGKAVLLPDTEKTSALYQTIHVPGTVLPSPSCLIANYGTKQLTPLTAFYGMIITYKDGSHARAYKALPAGSPSGFHTSYLFDINLSSQVDSLKIGAVIFGKRGGGSVVLDTLLLIQYCD